VSPELVAMTLQALIQHDRRAMQKIAEDYIDQAEVLVGKFSDSGDWHLENILPQKKEERLAEVIAKIGWKRLMLRESERFSEIGSECFAVRDAVHSVDEVAGKIKEKLKRNRFIQQNLHKVKADLGRLVVHADNEEAWDHFRARLGGFTERLTAEEELYRTPLRRLLEVRDEVNFVWVKECRERIDRMICRGEIERKALRYFEENLEG
jgi:hypothetical protein